LALPGTFLTPGSSTLVGRLVANTELLKALVRHGSFESYAFFLGEGSDREPLRQLFIESGAIAPERAQLLNVLQLPAALAAGQVSVLHHFSHVDQLFDLVWSRDRYASSAIPVSGQIHSLSYPRLMQSYLRGLLHAPGPGDAIFCSSSAGRQVVEKSFAAAAAALGRPPRPLDCALPVIPLGVDTERLRGGDRAATRARLGLPDDAIVILTLGRFTEYDKMDLLPLMQVFQRLRPRHRDPRRPLHLLLAGARQGTKTPEMLALWARALGIGDAVTIHVDFADAEKRDLLAAADLFCSPCDNLQETFGISVIEAMAAGLPVVVSDFDGYKDTVTDDVGIRVTTRWSRVALDALSQLGPLLYERPLHLFLGQAVEIDLAELEEALHALASDHARRAEMSRRAADQARLRFDWKTVVAKYEAVWTELAAVAPGPRATARSTVREQPLPLRFAEVFSHYPTATHDPGRRVARTPLSRTIGDAAGNYVIYPELKNIFSGEDVMAALALADAPVSLDDLVGQLTPRWPEADAWRGAYLVSWLLKHGLIR
jgi:glycosyltransferase involved in cell wall biosynthesis